jgi:hypothetical protein
MQCALSDREWAQLGRRGDRGSSPRKRSGLPLTCFCNSFEISIRALEVQGAAIFNRRLLESGRFQTAPPWVFHVIPAPKITPSFSKSSE